MYPLILAAEAAAHEPPGDAFMTLALVLAGVAMLITAIATVVVTPRSDH